jgi:hypothetical protein
MLAFGLGPDHRVHARNSTPRCHGGRRRGLDDGPHRGLQERAQDERAYSLRGLRPAEGPGPLFVHRRVKGAPVTRERSRTIGSLIATAIKAFALISLARTIGPRRIGRLAALAAEGYFLRSRRRGASTPRSTHA